MRIENKNVRILAQAQYASYFNLRYINLNKKDDFLYICLYNLESVEYLVLYRICKIFNSIKRIWEFFLELSILKD